MAESVEKSVFVKFSSRITRGVDINNVVEKAVVMKLLNERQRASCLAHKENVYKMGDEFVTFMIRKINSGKEYFYEFLQLLKDIEEEELAKEMEAEVVDTGHQDKKLKIETNSSTPTTEDLEEPTFSMGDGYDKPLALQQDDYEKIKKVNVFSEDVRVVIQSCNKAEYRAALEKLKPFQDFDSPVKHFDTELIIVVGMFAGQKTAIVQTAQGEKCKEQLRKAFKIFPNARLLLGLGICYGIKDNAVNKPLKFADVLVASEVGISTTPKSKSEGYDPREDSFERVQPLVFNIFCEDSEWDGITVCKVPAAEQRTAKVYVGRLCSASILMNDPHRMKLIKEPWRKYLGGEMEGWAQFKVSPQCIIIKGISDFADGKKNDKWQLTAAKAAVSYAHKKLEEFGYIDYDKLKIPSF